MNALTGVIKVALALEYGLMPGNLHYHRDTPNPESEGLRDGTLVVRATVPPAEASNPDILSRSLWFLQLLQHLHIYSTSLSVLCMIPASCQCTHSCLCILDCRTTISARICAAMALCEHA